MDVRSPRDGKAIEELGHYDPMVRETDARAILNGERIAYWMSVGAIPTDKVRVLIKKYGVNGTHLPQQLAALERIKTTRPTAPPPRHVPLRKAKNESAAQAEPSGDASESVPPESAPESVE